MENWIRDLLNTAIGPVKSAVNAVFERVAAVWSSIVTVGIGVRNAWRNLVNGARHKLAQLRALMQQVFSTLWWIVWVRIPQQVNTATNSIVNWTTRVIGDTQTFLQATIANVLTWARTQLTNLRADLESFGGWARGQIVSIVANVLFVMGRVAALLLDPAHMAEWVFGALTRKVLNFVDTNAEALFDLLLQRGAYYAGKFASRIEEVLVRLL